MVSEQSSIWEAPASPMMRQTSHAPRKFKGEVREPRNTPLQRGATINKWRHSQKKLMKWTAMMQLPWHNTSHSLKREVTVCYTQQKKLKLTLAPMDQRHTTHFMLRRVKCRQIICRATHLEMSVAKIGATLITAMRWSLKLKLFLMRRSSIKL